MSDKLGNENGEDLTVYPCLVYDMNIGDIKTCKKCLKDDIERVYIKYTDYGNKKIKIVAKRCKNCGLYLISRRLYKKDPKSFKIIRRMSAKRRSENNTKRMIKQGDKNDISVRDFVIKSNVFKCMKKSHEIENIVATVKIINKKGEILEKRIPAGYCNECNIYFIMNEMYEKLKSSGIILCRITDEKSYMNHSILSNGMELAQESILMQYGYNVSQKTDLTDVQRQKLLSEIVDYKILTPSEIVSYLDFFINQRKSQPKYEIAISKWVKDRQFISSYGYDGARNVKVRSVKTRH